MLCCAVLLRLMLMISWCAVLLRLLQRLEHM
jgi:hypothetical protein